MQRRQKPAGSSVACPNQSCPRMHALENAFRLCRFRLAGPRTSGPLMPASGSVMNDERAGGPRSGETLVSPRLLLPDRGPLARSCNRAVSTKVSRAPKPVGRQPRQPCLDGIVLNILHGLRQVPFVTHIPIEIVGMPERP